MSRYVLSLAVALTLTSADWVTPRRDVPKGSVTEFSIRDTAYGRDRRVWVYTPAGYDSAAATRHPLLVLFDGESYAAELAAPAILDNLIAEKAIPPAIALMVDNSVARLDDLANHRKFADFAANELVPWARSKWRVESDPSKTIAGGYSAGGLAAAYVAFRHPEVFGNVLSQSGAFWRGNEGASGPTEWLTEQFRGSKRLNVRFYIEVGALETHHTAGGPIFIETNRRLRDVLKKKGYQVEYAEIPGAQHEPGHWRAQLGDGIAHLSAPHQ